jgi:hypothetical protein
MPGRGGGVREHLRNFVQGLGIALMARGIGLDITEAGFWVFMAGALVLVLTIEATP